MADQLTVRQAESVRLMIDSSKVVNRLQNHLEGEVELSATQVQAAKILLDKSLPSLQSADITAHSSPQIESQEALIEQLRAIIAKNPQLISQLGLLPAPYAVHDAAPHTDTPAAEQQSGSIAVQQPADEGVKSA